MIFSLVTTTPHKNIRKFEYAEMSRSYSDDRMRGKLMAEKINRLQYVSWSFKSQIIY